MKCLFALMVAVSLAAATPAAQAPVSTLYIAPTTDGLEVYLAAAMHKKKVPVTIVTDGEGAMYTLTAAPVEVEKVSTGAKWASCIFAYCAGAEDKASTSVLLKDNTGAIVWSYSVNKGRGSKNRQSMAESIAEHLKDDFLAPRKRR